MAQAEVSVFSVLMHNSVYLVGETEGAGARYDVVGMVNIDSCLSSQLASAIVEHAREHKVDWASGILHDGHTLEGPYLTKLQLRAFTLTR